MLPATGSTMTAATSPAARARSTDSRSLNRATRVSATVPSGTPGLSGSPRVAKPLPAWTRNGSAWPW